MLFGSTVIETAIGLALVYLLLSLLCSAIQELLAQLLALRSATLFQGIETMLTPRLALLLYQHPLINTQFRQGQFDKLLNRTGRPSYISSPTFALTLLDVLQTEAAKATKTQAAAEPVAAASTAVVPAPPAATSRSDAVRAAVAALPEEHVRRVLLLLLDNVEGDYTKFVASLQQWYDDTMNRVSGWYKRKVQILLIVIGLLITVALGVDTVSVATALWKEPTLRAQAVAVAQHVTQNPANGAGQSIGDLNKQLNDLQLPMGWANPPKSGDLGAWAIKILGLLLTTCAVSLGAPFWFGVLNRVVNIRATGPTPPSTSTSAGSPAAGAG